MRLREGVSPGLVLSGQRLSSSPSNITRFRTLLVLSELGVQLKKEWELGRGGKQNKFTTVGKHSA